MRIIFFLSVCVISSCKQKQPVKTTIAAIATTSVVSSSLNSLDYSRKKLLAKKLLHNHTLETDKLHIQISRFITDSIIPCWYGTPWNFNGCTTEPGKGSIACGYFVTTVLKDAGLQLNRIKLAQQPSGIIIHQLCNRIKMFCNQPVQNLVEYVKKMTPAYILLVSIFMLGLSIMMVKRFTLSTQVTTALNVC